MKVEEINELINSSFFEYGSTYTEEEFASMFQISKPNLIGSSVEIISEVKRYELEKMNTYSSINKQLLSLGRCLIQTNSNYRVPLINEITSHINKYYRVANNKFKSAEKLRRGFEQVSNEHGYVDTSFIARIDSLKRKENKIYKPLS